jgi:putative redox protein
METHTIDITWKDKMAFDGHLDNHTLRIDTGGKYGDDTGPSPKKLLLASLAGCTGMDVVSLLGKMRVPFTGLTVEVEADLTEEHPRVYSEFRLKYIIYGKDIDHQKVEKAVDLSQEKYCSVSAMLKKNCPIIFKIQYVD